MTNTIRYQIGGLAKEFDLLLIERGTPGKEDLRIPCSIFSDALSPFEAVTKYAIENLKISYSEAGRLLNRDRRVIWTTYKRAASKAPTKFQAGEGALSIPIAYFSAEELSVSEIIVGYLKDEIGLRNCEIARQIRRDEKTVWTLYDRYRKKKNA
jgi:hypothetical protein